MAKRRAGEVAEDLAAVVDIVRRNTNGARSGEIAAALKDIPQRTIRRLAKRPRGRTRPVRCRPR